MSHISKITNTKITSIPTLVKALLSLGVPKECIEINETPVPIYDYDNRATSYRWKGEKDARFKNGDVAHVIIRKEKIDRLVTVHNDVGFYVAKTGAVLMICDYALEGATTAFDEINKLGGFSAKFIKKLGQEYVVQEAVSHYEKSAKRVTVEKMNNGKKKIVVEV